MPRFECSNYESWRLRMDDFTKMNKFCSIFKDCRLELSFIAGSGTVVFDYELGTAKKPITLFGFTVDLEDGWIYMTRVGDIPSFKVGVINDLFAYFTGSAVGRDAALRAAEKFKLTGSITKMFETLDESAEGSMISVSLHKVVRSSLSVRNNKVEEFVRIYKDIGDVFYNIYRIFGDANRMPSDVVTQIKKDFSPTVRTTNSYIHDGEWFPRDKTTEEALYLASSPAYWRDKESLNSATSVKRALLASNTMEICESMDGAEDVVLTTDVAGRLKKHGFDTLLTSRELSSITSNSSYIETVKKSALVNANVVDPSRGGIRSMRWGSPRDATAAIIRNSIKMLHKVIVKVKGVKEGE